MKYYIMLTPTHTLLTPLHPINPPSLTLSTYPLNPPSLNPPHPFLSTARYKVDIHLNWATMKYYIMLNDIVVVKDVPFQATAIDGIRLSQTR